MDSPLGLWTLRDCAEALGVKYHTLVVYRQRGEFDVAPVTTVGRSPLFDRDAVLAWDEARPGQGWRSQQVA